MSANIIVPRPSAESPVKELLRRNKEYSLTEHRVPLSLPELTASMPNTPSTFIYTCMDPRCNPDHFLKPTGPLEFVSHRTVGGRVAGKITDLVALDSLFKFTTVFVIHHTDCGINYMSEDAIRANLKSGLPASEADPLHLQIYSDAEREQNVKGDVQLVRDSPFLRKQLRDNVHGFVYDLNTGLLTPVA